MDVTLTGTARYAGVSSAIRGHDHTLSIADLLKRELGVQREALHLLLRGKVQFSDLAMPARPSCKGRLEAR